jgi:DNA-binding Lrp family transcriptional regulator
VIDFIDLKILAELQKDAGRPQKVLASDLDITEATLSKKIKKLITDKVIRKYTIDVNYSDIGYLFSALTMVKEKKQSDSEVTGRTLVEIPEAIQVYKVTGDWDFVVVWLCKNPEQLDNVVSKVLNHANVDRVQTTFFLRAIKREAGIPLETIINQLK